VKSHPGSESFLNILAESGDVLEVAIVVFRDGHEVEKIESMPRRLFETLLRTDYLREIPNHAAAARKSA